MSKYLAIETATPVCSVALLEDEKVLRLKESDEKNSHSKVLTVFIQEILDELQLDAKDLDAIAVSKGPGSYTGLRIGVSSAKGLCYAGDLPLISVNTLYSMALGVIHDNKITQEADSLFVPMIDARRMEVYSAVFDLDGNKIRDTKAEIIDENSFADYFENHILYFFGDGAEKCRDVITHQNARFIDNFQSSAAFMGKVVHQKFLNKTFEDVAYFEPFYLKDFIAGAPKVKGLR
jgi:tRNA threonylcarbamoyladenosine biosynthesis protein TsaB